MIEISDAIAEAVTGADIFNTLFEGADKSNGNGSDGKIQFNFELHGCSKCRICGKH